MSVSVADVVDMCDDDGFYLTIRAKAPSTFSYSHELKRALYLKGFKCALVSARIPTIPSSRDKITISIVVYYPHMINKASEPDDPKSYEQRERRFRRQLKFNSNCTGELSAMMGEVKTFLESDEGMADCKVRLARRPINPVKWYMQHDNEFCPPLKLVFDENATSILGFPPNHSYYHVSVQKKSTKKLEAAAKKALIDNITNRFNALADDDEDKKKGLEEYMKEALETEEPEPVLSIQDEKDVYVENQLWENPAKLFIIPNNLRVKTDILTQPVLALQQDAAYQLGDLIPYANMSKTMSCYHEVRHLNYFPVKEIEIKRIAIDIRDEDGNIYKYPYDHTNPLRLELRYHFKPPDKSLGQMDILFPVTYKAYSLLKRTHKVQLKRKRLDSPDESSSSADSSMNTVGSVQSSTSHLSRMFEVSQAAGYNKLSLSNKATIAAGFGN